MSFPIRKVSNTYTHENEHNYGLEHFNICLVRNGTEDKKSAKWTEAGIPLKQVEVIKY
jgi:hypothetical protein